MAKKTTKQLSAKRTEYEIWGNPDWKVVGGRLVPPRGRPRKAKSLFRHVAEKIPYEALDAVRKEFIKRGWTMEGVYVAHDSMGYARYVGRGNVFNRLKARYHAQPKELKYFSFYIVINKNHEREIETLMIRLGGAHLQFNSRKKRIDISPGNIRDHEAGTRFVERQGRRGRKSPTSRNKQK